MDSGGQSANGRCVPAREAFPEPRAQNSILVGQRANGRPAPEERLDEAAPVVSHCGSERTETPRPGPAAGPRPRPGRFRYDPFVGTTGGKTRSVHEDGILPGS